MTPAAAWNRSAATALRRARPEDRDAVEALLREADLPLDGVADHFGGYFVAEVYGRVVAAIGLEDYGAYGLLRSAVVAEAWRGCGVGEALTRELLAAARSARKEALYLLTTTASDYFPRFGFRQVSVDDVPAAVRASAEFRGACPATAVVMAARLDA